MSFLARRNTNTNFSSVMTSAQNGGFDTWGFVTTQITPQASDGSLSPYIFNCTSGLAQGKSVRIIQLSQTISGSGTYFAFASLQSSAGSAQSPQYFRGMYITPPSGNTEYFSFSPPSYVAYNANGNFPGYNTVNIFTTNDRPFNFWSWGSGAQFVVQFVEST